MRFGIVVAVQLALASCAAEPPSYTLYNAPEPAPNARVHVASFDTADGAARNRANCEAAMRLFQAADGQSAKYWCEPGRYLDHVQLMDGSPSSRHG